MIENSGHSFLIEYFVYLLMLGFLLCSTALIVYSYKVRSWLLRTAALGFFVCAFNIFLAEMIYPVKFTMDSTGKTTSVTYRPHWVSRLQVEGSPLALVISGLSLLAFAVRSKSRYDF